MDTEQDTTEAGAAASADEAGADAVRAAADPPPRHDEYPPGTLAAVVDDLGAANAAVAAISRHSSGGAYVIEATEVLRQDTARRADQNVLTKAYLAVASAVSDQQGFQRTYVEEAQLGHHMVVAKAGDDAEADAIWTTLKAHGAHDGTYYDRFTVREMV